MNYIYKLLYLITYFENGSWVFFKTLKFILVKQYRKLMVFLLGIIINMPSTESIDRSGFKSWSGQLLLRSPIALSLHVSWLANGYWKTWRK